MAEGYQVGIEYVDHHRSDIFTLDLNAIRAAEGDPVTTEERALGIFDAMHLAVSAASSRGTVSMLLAEASLPSDEIKRAFRKFDANYDGLSEPELADGVVRILRVSNLICDELVQLD